MTVALQQNTVVVTKWLLIERFTAKPYHPEAYAEQTAEVLHAKTEELHQYLIGRFASLMQKLEHNRTRLNDMCGEHYRIQKELIELKLHIELEQRLAQPDPVAQQNG